MIKAIIFDCFGVLVSDGFDNIIDDFNPSPDQTKEVAKLIDLACKGLIDLNLYHEMAAKELGITKEDYISRMSDNNNEYLYLF